MDKELLTNELLKKKFISQFELVGYAIKLAENMIQTGRGPRVKTETQNPAMQVLAEIVQGKDKFDEIIESNVQETDGYTADAEDSAQARGSERKRSKRSSE